MSAPPYNMVEVPQWVLVQEGSKCDQGCTRSLAILLNRVGCNCECQVQFGRGSSVDTSARRV